MTAPQLDLFADLDQAEADAAAAALACDYRAAPLQPLLGGTQRPAEWVAVHAEYRRRNGLFGAAIFCHAWALWRHGPGDFDGSPDELADAEGGPCRVVEMVLDIRCTASGHQRQRGALVGGHTGQTCHCVEAFLVRSECVGCGWRGPDRDFHRAGGTATLDGIEHLWGPVDHLPSVPSIPEGGTSKTQVAAMEKWKATAAAAYGQKWLEAGGPIWTNRQPMGSRHVPGRTPWGGYDLGRVVDGTVTP